MLDFGALSLSTHATKKTYSQHDLSPETFEPPQRAGRIFLRQRAQASALHEMFKDPWGWEIETPMGLVGIWNGCHPFPSNSGKLQRTFFWGGSGSKHVIILIVTVYGKGWILYISFLGMNGH